jgi:hypothetical protein
MSKIVKLLEEDQCIKLMGLTIQLFTVAKSQTCYWYTVSLYTM